MITDHHFITVIAVVFTIPRWMTFAVNNTTDLHEDNSNNTNLPCPIVSDKDIFDLLLRNYSTVIRPVRDGSESMTITVALRIFGIQDFAEIEGTLHLDAYLDLSWPDAFLRWDWSWPHQCLDSIVLPSESVWLPDVVLLNSPFQPNIVTDSKGVKVSVQNDGSVDFASVGRLDFICELYLAYFPFDQQICTVHMESWTYPSRREHLQLRNDSAVTILNQLWTENKLWRLLDIKSLQGNTTYPDDVYDKIVYYLILERKALYYYINVIIPSLVIAVVELVTFFLPLTEVVKVHISFTCLLAYSVFQSMVITDLPRTSASVPLLCLYIDLQMCYIGLALVGEGVVFHFAEYSVKKKHVPAKFLETFRFIARLLLMHHIPEIRFVPVKQRKKLDKLSQPYFDIIPKKYAIGTLTTLDSPPTIPIRRVQSAKDRQRYWLFIGEVTERINLIIYVCLISITPGIMFGVMPYHQPNIYNRLQHEFLNK